MKPHPEFRDREIPRQFTLGALRLKALTTQDLVRDYCAVMDSAQSILAANPGSSWPKGLTLEQNLIDLAWHQVEFEQRRSFAWIMEDDSGTHTGCLYVYPSIAGQKSADVRWWFRPGAEADDAAFRRDLDDWLRSPPWPELDYRFQPKQQRVPPS